LGITIGQHLVSFCTRNLSETAKQKLVILLETYGLKHVVMLLLTSWKISDFPTTALSRFVSRQDNIDSPKFSLIHYSREVAIIG